MTGECGARTHFSCWRRYIRQAQSATCIDNLYFGLKLDWMGIAADAVGALYQFLAQSLKCFDATQAVGALQNMNLKLVPCGRIKPPTEVLFCEFVPM